MELRVAHLMGIDLDDDDTQSGFIVEVAGYHEVRNARQHIWVAALPRSPDLAEARRHPITPG